MYREYLTHAEREEIVSSDRGNGTSPHCNESVFHVPGLCAYCDGYYRRHPEFRPVAYAPRVFNGWGGNTAPIVDDVKAAEERASLEALWQEVFADFPDEPVPARPRKRSTFARIFGRN